MNEFSERLALIDRKLTALVEYGWAHRVDGTVRRSLSEIEIDLGRIADRAKKEAAREERADNFAYGNPQSNFNKLRKLEKELRK
jgi:hypothetical protein